MLVAHSEIVMSSDERQYMRALATTATRRGGAVLEIGFGMGIASSMIQEELSVARHFIVEANHQVLQRCLAWKNRLSQMCAREDPVSSLRPVGSNAAAAIHCIDGFWEEVMPFLADSSLDAILFDPYPAIVTFDFLRVASRLLKPGGVLTFFLARPHFVPSAARDQDFWKAQQDQLARAGFAVADVPEHLMLRVRDDCGAPQLATCFYRYLAFLVPVAVKR